ncbi:MAG: acyloxyacyl hydrolase [Nitrospirota bacterium]
MGTRAVHCWLLLIGVLLLFSCPNRGFAADKQGLFEVAVGGGINLNGINTNQVLFVSALSFPIKGAEMMRFGLEGDLEFIEYHGRVTFIGGVAPFFRATWQRAGIRPFAEIGGGINYSSRKRVDGRELNGPFLFSAMGGAGIEVLYNKMPMRIAYRLRHLSNGHLYKGNEGFNTQYLMLSIGF